MFPARPSSGEGNRPGEPTGRALSADEARKHEQLLIDSGDPAVEWDRRADARQAAWDASPFAAGFAKLMTLKRAPHVPKQQEPDVIPFPPMTGWF